MQIIKMSNNVEPKKVLQMINSMGYKNVSASELKQFTKGNFVIKNDLPVDYAVYLKLKLIVDLKKLMKYEQKPKNTSSGTTQIIQAPENVINVTIIKESSPKKCDQQPTMCAKNTVEKNTVDQARIATEEIEVKKPDEAAAQVKQRKRLLRLPRHIRTKDPKIIFKRGIVSGVKNGVLVRNTPTDLYQKYQDDWAKFKDFIPGENSRLGLRNSVRKKMQHKDEGDDKVSPSVILPCLVD